MVVLKKHMKFICFLSFIVLFLGFLAGVFKPTFHLQVNESEIDYIEIYATGGKHILKESSQIKAMVRFLENFKLTKYKGEHLSSDLLMEIRVYNQNGNSVDRYFFCAGHISFNDAVYKTKIPNGNFYEKIEKFLVEHGFIDIESAQFISDIQKNRWQKK